MSDPVVLPITALGREMLYKCRLEGPQLDTYTPGGSNRRHACRIFFGNASSFGRSPEIKVRWSPLGYVSWGDELGENIRPTTLHKIAQVSRIMTTLGNS